MTRPAGLPAEPSGPLHLTPSKAFTDARVGIMGPLTYSLLNGPTSGMPVQNDQTEHTRTELGQRSATVPIISDRQEPVTINLTTNAENALDRHFYTPVPPVEPDEHRWWLGIA
jgi:hypothetical protein